LGREANASKVIKEEPLKVAEDRITNPSKDVSVKEEPHQRIIK
jgi:hypothetical protein